MNRGQLRSALTSRLGLPITGDALLDTSELINALDAALRDMCNEYDWPWLVAEASLTFTTGVAPKPSGCVKVKELVVNDRRAKFAPLAAYLDIAARGAQCVWTETGTNVKITPVPTTAPDATLYYVQAEPALASDTTEPLLPATYHQTLLARAAYHANVRRNRMEDAARDDNEFQLSVRKMKDAGWARTGPRYVRSAGTSLWANW